MHWRTIAALALFVTSAAAAPAGAPQLPGWMAGCWEQHHGAEWTEECWMPPRGGMMLGMSRTGSGGRVSEWESMQIVLNDETASDHAVVRMAFWAAPGGKDRTVFAWSPSRQAGVTFYNVAHDYPQRIRYWREGAALMAEISMADGSRTMRWRYTRAK
jgi:hypothetical protein